MTMRPTTARGSVAPPAAHGLEEIVSKRADRPYLPDDRGAWIKTKCLSRAESVVGAGQIRRGQGRFSARFRSVISTMMAAYSMPAGSNGDVTEVSPPCSIAG